MLVAHVSRTPEEKGFPLRQDHCFMHAQPIRRPLFGHMTIGVQFLEKIFEQAGMAAKQLLQNEIIPAAEWGMHLEASIHFLFIL